MLVDIDFALHTLRAQEVIRLGTIPPPEANPEGQKKLRARSPSKTEGTRIRKLIAQQPMQSPIIDPKKLLPPNKESFPD